MMRRIQSFRGRLLIARALLILAPLGMQQARSGVPPPPPPFLELESIDVTPRAARRGKVVKIVLQLTAPVSRRTVIPVRVEKDNEVVNWAPTVVVQKRRDRGFKKVKFPRRLARGTYELSATFGGITQTTTLTVNR